LTHGFVVDGEGKKMSKSLGNVVEPQEVIDRFGAEILRLWVAAEDYTADIRISEEIITRLVEAYRRIRNTQRFILGNLYDFDPVRDTVPFEEMAEMDRFALHRLQKIVRRVRDAYERYQLHVVYYTLYNYCTVDLSALYLDVLKDRLYTSRPDEKGRRSAQTAMYTIIHALSRLLAPILTFTAEEIWSYLPGEKENCASVHLTSFPEVEERYCDEALAETWQVLLDLRAEVARAIEMRAVKRSSAIPSMRPWRSLPQNVFAPFLLAGRRTCGPSLSSLRSAWRKGEPITPLRSRATPCRG